MRAVNARSRKTKVGPDGLEQLNEVITRLGELPSVGQAVGQLIASLMHALVHIAGLDRLR